MTRETMRQAAYYVGAFFLTWTFPTILRIQELLEDEVYYHWVLLSAMFVPSQGIWNFWFTSDPDTGKGYNAIDKRRSDAAEILLPPCSDPNHPKMVLLPAQRQRTNTCRLRSRNPAQNRRLTQQRILRAKSSLPELERKNLGPGQGRRRINFTRGSCSIVILTRLF
jgi:hypothetical protein